MGQNVETELTAAQSCRRLGITLDCLYRLLYSGKLPGRKEEGMWKIPVSAVVDRIRRKAMGMGGGKATKPSFAYGSRRHD